MRIRQVRRMAMKLLAERGTTIRNLEQQKSQELRGLLELRQTQRSDSVAPRRAPPRPARHTPDHNSYKRGPGA